MGEEGCLSLPGEFDELERHESIIVKFLDRKGAEHGLKLAGLNARIVQHEVDHIEGILYIDRIEVKKGFAIVQKPKST